MSRIIRAGEMPRQKNRTLRFEGHKYGLPVSFFHVMNKPGEGPPLHTHTYFELWLVLWGSVLFTVGDKEYKLRMGEVAVVDPGVPHKFKNINLWSRLHLMCIHCSSTIEQVNLE